MDDYNEKSKQKVCSSEFNQEIENESEELSAHHVHPSEADFDFWKVNNYKKTVKRIDDGAKVCDSFAKMVSERAEIEGQYSTKLQGWSKKWCDVITKGPEYGVCQESWLSFTKEAEKIAEIYSELQNRLLSQVCESIAAWKNANYHKSLLNWKESKTAEEGFSKAQKPWAKKNDEVMKCKKSYYAACVARDQAEKLYSGSITESNSQTEEQVKKLQDKVNKCKTDVITIREKYQEAIRDITNYNPKYKDDMVYMFEKLQAAEEKRKTFMKHTMQSFCQVLQLRNFFDRFSHIYDKLSQGIDKSEPASDLSWWAVACGAGMPFKWLEYEEYQANSPGPQPSTQETHDAKNMTNKSDSVNSNTSVLKKSTVCATL